MHDPAAAIGALHEGSAVPDNTMPRGEYGFDKMGESSFAPPKESSSYNYSSRTFHGPMQRVLLITKFCTKGDL